ncbi:MAG: STAS domain-containing protein [Akkermansiaceae bacterium]|nr:STAS domain-containing protein [Akkermansiaceae bacterium]MDP4648119.1 STAS domain-containing protein [Akkermansiaceae bacterium]MDP4719667.1 STAS domain-containing protein [Akkermansiaceae bacterium]MDP4780611.1 STAS domain-containing protein [Akkermansiaceae bacterium]MDP4846846.1 STAS domain-containing protein [Akkermansiaceae bacterium]
MVNDCPIRVGKFEGFSWIRCEGKGSFLNSPAVKEFGEVRVRKGEKLLVVDLQDCSGMDSTFMGTLAGLANRLKENGGELEVADAGEKNRASLEDLGLDFLMEIEPEEAVWKGLEDKARDFLKLKVAGMRAGTQMHTRHILEAHQLLSEANEGNQEKFSGVVSLLEKQVAEKEKG